MPVKKNLLEAEIRTGLREGGQVLGFVIVERPGDGYSEYVAYIRVSWTRGYRILRTWRDKTDREYRSLGLLYQSSRDFGYMLPVTVYRAGCAELLRFRGVLARDGGSRQESEPSAEASGFRGVLPEDQPPAAGAPGGGDLSAPDNMDENED